MNQKERMYKLHKTISALQEAVNNSDNVHMPFTKYDKILFEVHIKSIEALEMAKEAMEIEFYEGDED